MTEQTDFHLKSLAERPQTASSFRYRDKYIHSLFHEPPHHSGTETSIHSLLHEPPQYSGTETSIYIADFISFHENLVWQMHVTSK